MVASKHNTTYAMTTSFAVTIYTLFIKHKTACMTSTHNFKLYDLQSVSPPTWQPHPLYDLHIIIYIYIYIYIYI